MERNCDNCGRNKFKDEACASCYGQYDTTLEKIIGGPSNWIPQIIGDPAPVDMVNKPNHYRIFGDKDCFDAMIELFGKEAVQTYCVLNAFTYIWRHARKNGTEDVLKAEYNLAKFKELEEHE